MSEIEKCCAEIADRVEPGFRVTGQRSCSSHSAKRWNAAYEAARLGLSAAEPQPAPSVAVKALEWKDARGDGSFVANTDIGLLYIASAKAWGFRNYPDAYPVSGGIDATKAAAQSDYETRILSALSVQVQDVAGLSCWEGWDKSRDYWSETKHRDAVMHAMFRGPWSMEDAATLLGFIDRTWPTAPEKQERA